MNQSAQGQEKTPKSRDQDLLDDEDDLFMTMTPQEKKAWEKMMAIRITTMKKNQADSQKWKDNLTRRRMFVLSRIRKLHAAQMDRFRFLLKMAETLKNVKEDKGDNPSPPANVGGIADQIENVGNENPDSRSRDNECSENSGNERPTQERDGSNDVKSVSLADTSAKTSSSENQSVEHSNDVPAILVEDASTIPAGSES